MALKKKTLYLDPEVWDTLSAIKDMTGAPVSETIRRAVATYARANPIPPDLALKLAVAGNGEFSVTAILSCPGIEGEAAVYADFDNGMIKRASIVGDVYFPRRMASKVHLDELTGYVPPPSGTEFTDDSHIQSLLNTLPQNHVDQITAQVREVVQQKLAGLGGRR